MKVKEVRVEKLFSLESYNNERIGFVAELSDAEDEGKVVAELFFKICQIEACLNAYRYIARSHCLALETYRSDRLAVDQLKREAEELKAELEKTADELERVQKLIRLKRLTEDLKAREERLARAEEELSRLERAREELKRRIKNGEYTLEGLGVPMDELKRMEVA